VIWSAVRTIHTFGDLTRCQTHSTCPGVDQDPVV
jgi:hypothetical protein